MKSFVPSENNYGENRQSNGQGVEKLNTPKNKGNLLQNLDLNKDNAFNVKNSNEKAKSAKKEEVGTCFWDFDDLEDLKEGESCLDDDEIDY